MLAVAALALRFGERDVERGARAVAGVTTVEHLDDDIEFSSDTSAERVLVDGATAGTAAEPPPVETSPDLGRILRVVRGLSDDPLPNVLVDLHEEGEERETSGLLGDATGRWRRFRADAGGRVVVPADYDGYASYEADAGFGWIYVDEDRLDDDAVIRVFPDASVSVHVVDEHGAAVSGASVSLETFDGTRSTGYLLDRRHTDDDGCATFTRLRAEASTNLELGNVFRARLDGVFDPLPHVDFAFEELPLDEDPVFVYPPRTTLVVRLVDADGQPVRGQASVTAERALDNGVERGVRVDARDGIARFDALGVGIDLVLDVWTEDDRRPQDDRARSAEEPGGVATVDVELSPPAPSFAARLVGPDGAPATLRRFLITDLGAPQWRRTVTTDARGTFVYTDDEQHADLLIVELDRETPRFARLAIDLPGRGERLELGDVPLSPMPVLAQGRVVNARGEPVGGAAVLATADDAFWRPVRSAADGSFTALAPDIDGLSFRLEAAHPRLGTSAAIDVPLGTDGLTIVLDDASGIAGSVVVDQPWMLPLVGVFCTRSASRDAVEVSGVDSNATFLLWPVPPGAYTVTVGLGESTEQPLVKVDVDVPVSVTTTHPPALQQIDLRGRIHPIKLRARDDAGAPVRLRRAFVRVGANPDWVELAPVDDELCFVATAPSVEVAALASPGRFVRATGLRDGDVLRVAGSPRKVTLRVDEPNALLRLSNRLGQEARLRSASATPPFEWLTANEIDLSQRMYGWDLEVPRAGNYELCIEYHPLDELDPLPELTIELPFAATDDEIQEVIVRLPQAAIDLAEKIAAEHR
jgi:hypothetical protein